LAVRGTAAIIGCEGKGFGKGAPQFTVIDWLRG
jgi:hypothetical protein